MEETGCPMCLVWAQDRHSAERPAKSDVLSSFARDCFFFNAYLMACGSCGTTWLDGYIEEESDAEWGPRWWTTRALTPEQLVTIQEMEGTSSLDLRTFAVEGRGWVWTQG
ncbi:hypothetical protein IMCC26207_109657 [Actinobacteria bacterium IMCC26207]|nr:hypothetical protein IMCC26207_109657 [Actinobacteria bacterium IMCC26207]